MKKEILELTPASEIFQHGVPAFTAYSQQQEIIGLNIVDLKVIQEPKNIERFSYLMLHNPSFWKL